MLKLFPKTLFGQLLAGILLVQTVFLAGFLAYTILSQRALTEERTRHRLDIQLERLSRACAKLLAKGDPSSVTDSLELARASTALDVVRLTDLNGKTLAVTSNDTHGFDEQERAALATGASKHVYRVANGQWEAGGPVVVDGRPVAMIWLEPSHAPALSTANTIVRISLTYGLVALVINIVPIFFIVRMTTKPLRRLREAALKMVKQPGQDGVFPLPVTVSNEAGQLTASFNAMVDTLEQQRGGLLDTLALLDSLLGNAPIGFGFFDAQLRCVRANEMLTAVFVGNGLTQVQELVAHVFADGRAQRNVEIEHERRHWLLNCYPVRSGEAVWRVGVIAGEITERLKTEETMRRTEKLAATGRLAASIAHEINNPLEAVTNLLYLLRTHEGMDAQATEFVETAQGELQRVAEITQQTLRFYRQSSSPSGAKVRELLESVVKLYQTRLLSLEVTLGQRYRGTPEVFGFGGELRQVFANFVGNALDAMPKGGKLVLRARPGCGRGADGVYREGVRIFVADTGMGMSPETLRRAFEAFYTTKQATGTGLGLWLSEEIVRKHGGRVRVKSRVGQGTVFAVFVPSEGVGQAGMEMPA